MIFMSTWQVVCACSVLRRLWWKVMVLICPDIHRLSDSVYHDVSLLVQASNLQETEEQDRFCKGGSFVVLRTPKYCEFQVHKIGRFLCLDKINIAKLCQTCARCPAKATLSRVDQTRTNRRHA